MVAYALVRELTFMSIVLGGTTISIVMALHAPGELVTIAPVAFTALLAALGKSRPSEALDVGKLTSGAGLVWLLVRWKFGLGL